MPPDYLEMVPDMDNNSAATDTTNVEMIQQGMFPSRSNLISWFPCRKQIRNQLIEINQIILQGQTDKHSDAKQKQFNYRIVSVHILGRIL